MTVVDHPSPQQKVCPEHKVPFFFICELCALKAMLDVVRLIEELLPKAVPDATNS